MRGRRPKPTHLKILNGNPGKRPLNREEPSPPPLADPTVVPSELAHDPLASAEWQRLVPMLVAAGWVTEAERSPCLAYCQQWSTYLQAQECLTRDGLLVTGSTGTTVAHPASWVSKNALTHCEKLWVELGLTPTSRSRVRAVAPAKTAAERAKDEYFGRPPA